MIEAKPEQLQQLDYNITNSQTLCGQGNINSIKTGDGYWRAYIGTDASKLKCQLKNNCTIVSVEMKISNVMMIQFTGYFNQKQQFNQLKCLSSKQRESGDIVKYSFKCEGNKVEEISVDLHSYNKKQVMISYLKFMGKVVSKRRLSKKANFQLFSQRTKQAAPKRTSKQQSKNDSSKQKQKIERINRQEQIKKTNNQQKSLLQNKANLNLQKNKYYRQEDLLQPEQCQMKKNYKTRFVSQTQIQEISEVTQKWVEMQRKMESSYGVEVDHRLSVKLFPKCFNGLKFCLPNIYGQQKSNYVKIIKQLGGLVREQPSQGCIVATSHPKNSNVVGIARLMNNTHIVRLNYIDECYKQKTRLKFHKFQYLHEEQFI